MLFLTMREGDYFLVGDQIRIAYERSDGKDSMVVSIEAPKDITVLRGKVYEEQLAAKAAAGDEAARALSTRLGEEYERRKKRYNARRASREEQQRRIDAGEIKPCAAPQPDLAPAVNT